MASIQPASDHGLVSKTYYTTYTYFSTFFFNSTSSVSSREETDSNVITFTKVGDQLSRLPEILTTLFTTYTHLTTIDRPFLQTSIVKTIKETISNVLPVSATTTPAALATSSPVATQVPELLADMEERFTDIKSSIEQTTEGLSHGFSNYNITLRHLRTQCVNYTLRVMTTVQVLSREEAEEIGWEEEATQFRIPHHSDYDTRSVTFTHFDSTAKVLCSLEVLSREEADERWKRLEGETKDLNSVITTSTIPTTSTITTTSTASPIFPTPSFQDTQYDISSSNVCKGSFMWFCLN